MSGLSLRRVFTNLTHSDNPTKVKTYDFIGSVSLRGHSQYLAACAKMTPWQSDCKMPSINMGALVGTPIWAGVEDAMVRGRPLPVVPVVARRCDVSSSTGPYTRYDRPDTKHRREPKEPAPLLQGAVSGDPPLLPPERTSLLFSSHIQCGHEGRTKDVAACSASCAVFARARDISTSTLTQGRQMRVVHACRC
jgi:hypothetical protein